MEDAKRQTLARIVLGAGAEEMLPRQLALLEQILRHRQRHRQ